MGGPAADVERRVEPDRWWRDRVAMPLAGLLVIALLVGINRSFWYDEAISAVRTTWSLDELLEIRKRGDAPNAAYYLLLRFLTVGHDEIVLRLPSVVAAVGTMIVTVRLARRLFGATGAWVAGGVLLLHALIEHHGHEARPYALAMFMTTAAAWCAHEAMVTSDRTRWWQFGVLGAVGVLFHLSVALALAGMLIGLLITGGRRAQVLKGAVALLVPAAALLVFLPYLTEDRVRAVAWIPDLDASLLFGGLSALVTGAPRPALLVAVLCIVAVAVWRARPSEESARPRWSMGLVIGWAVAPVLGVLLISIAVQDAFVPRYIAVAVPAIALFMGGAFARVAAQALKPLAIALALVLTIGLWDHRVSRSGVEYQDWRGAAAIVDAGAESGDAVAVAPAFALAAFTFYSPRDDRPGVQVLVGDTGRPLRRPGGSAFAPPEHLYLIRSFGGGRPILDPAGDDLELVRAWRLDGGVIVELWQ